MVVPPPYDPVLLREHAFYDSHLRSLVIPPTNTPASGFKSISESGLGLFNYYFARNYEVDRVEGSYIFKNFLEKYGFLVFIFLMYFIYNKYVTMKNFKSHRQYEATKNIPKALLSPFLHATTTVKKARNKIQETNGRMDDIESSPILDGYPSDLELEPISSETPGSILSLGSPPPLSHSPYSPEELREERYLVPNNDKFLNTSSFLKFSDINLKINNADLGSNSFGRLKTE
ncbi:hypothetical protein PACTADRAFT_47573 [Pachysolen tannophilus NRRL Y-2460]|uniref:Uncharacterized protein n=1 Tax=Pachysolen tannophilus NRRL Y-2460 TaxID=669874 RepID=A0A1E4U145_PACTA|nr:hypothetical protein PACTADRAFT_47573 [Pachysolen tannophilus NRRL Y-2460]